MDSKLLHNAKVVLEASCRARAGDALVIVITKDGMAEVAPALITAALELGLVPATIDVRPFLRSPLYKTEYILKPLKAALEAADVVISSSQLVPGAARADYSRFLGDPDAHDKHLTAEDRWIGLSVGRMDQWTITKEEVLAMRARTLWLLTLLRSAKQGRVTSCLGTDLTFGLGPGATCTPILGIAPLYAEVAVVPDPKLTTGVFVVDGSTQMDVRPRSELDRQPLCITVEKGRMVAAKGDPVQLQRLKEFIASGDPAADSVDEVGILTTKFVDNDVNWSDRTHQHDSVHVALGNNSRRDAVVHGPRHMDGEVREPTISIDGLVVVKDGVFLDQVMQRRE